MNDSDAGANGTLAYNEFAASRDQRRVADLDAGDVRDRVERTRSAADRQLEIVLSRFGLRLRRHRDESERENEQSMIPHDVSSEPMMCAARATSLSRSKRLSFDAALLRASPAGRRS